MVYALVLARGVVTAIDNPARQSFVSEIVGSDRVVNAVALNSPTSTRRGSSAPRRPAA